MKGGFKGGRAGRLAVDDMRVESVRGAAMKGSIEPALQVAEYYQPAFEALVNGSAGGNATPPTTGPLFAPVSKPGVSDWLTEHEERGQPMQSYQRGQFRARPHGNFNTIVIVVLGDGVPHLKELEKYVRAFYQCNVVVRGPYKLAQIPTLRIRIGMAGQQQIFTKECQEFVLSVVRSDRELSRCSVGTIGITMEDLTPREEWNFVYGIASLTEGSGVFSLARFSPQFNGEAATPEEAANIIFHRACKVVTHELGHIFGLKHCINYSCLMNGVNHAGELQRQPLLECPVCTKKLTYSFGWDLLKRYECLATTYREFGMADEAARIAQIRNCAEHAMKESGVTPPRALGKVYNLSKC